MAKKKKKSRSSSEFSTGGFSRSYDASGTSGDVEDFLRQEGFLDEDEVSRPRRSSRKKSSGRTTRKRARKTSKKRGKSTATPKAPTLRKRGRRPFKGRHFRLPLETDDQLQFLTRHYDCYMLDVIKLAIHNEWLRATREQRREQRRRGGETSEGTDESRG